MNRLWQVEPQFVFWGILLNIYMMDAMMLALIFQLNSSNNIIPMFNTQSQQLTKPHACLLADWSGIAFLYLRHIKGIPHVVSVLSALTQQTLFGFHANEHVLLWLTDGWMLTSVPLQSLQRNGVPLLAMTPPHLILNRYSGHMRPDIAWMESDPRIQALGEKLRASRADRTVTRNAALPVLLGFLL
jgi:hypothetical protein